MNMIWRTSEQNKLGKLNRLKKMSPRGGENGGRLGSSTLLGRVKQLALFGGWWRNRKLGGTKRNIQRKTFQVERKRIEKTSSS